MPIVMRWNQVALAAVTIMLIAVPEAARSEPEGAAATRAAGLVPLAEIEPSIQQDIRYAGPHNFTGQRVPGYEAAACWLRPEAARALAKVQADLARQTPPLSLRVFDCYRPRRAVQAFVRWVGEADDGATRSYHPDVARRSLVAQGYIGPNSSHSRGIAVDLTLMRPSKIPDGATPQSNGTVLTDCTKPRGDNADGPGTLDMGTTFDCFDPKSNTAHAGITAEQRTARLTLKRVMERHGFTNYAREWWHFTYSGADGGRPFDVPVR
ncbi:MAG: M15 family metallopeptidase [Hyphomicrobiaceae bacterium]